MTGITAFPTQCVYGNPSKGKTMDSSGRPFPYL